MIPGDEKMAEILEQNKSWIVNLFHAYLEKGQAEGQFVTQQALKSIALMLYTLHSGLQVVAKVESDKDELGQMIEVPLSLLQDT